MSILVATDFSPCSQAALRLGTHLARRRNTSLLLVHAVETPAFDFPVLPMGATGLEQDLLAAAEVAIARELDQVRKEGISANTRVTMGAAAKVVLDAARDISAELIVVGTHGRKGAAHLFLGSVATSVVRGATCPVLVTRDAQADADRWQGRTPLRVAVAMDGAPASLGALTTAASLAPPAADDWSVIRLYWPPEEALRYGLHDPWDGVARETELLPLLERDLRRDLRASIGEAAARLRFRVASRDAAAVASEEATALNADLLVVGVPRHRAHGWASLPPAAVLRSSLVPVLCVPETAGPARRPLAAVRSILVATDLSEAGRDLIPAAYGLLLRTGGRVELCIVHETGAPTGVAEVPVQPPLDDRQRGELEKQLCALIPAEAEAVGITTNVSVLEGRLAAEALVAAAERLDVDLVAVGSHGRSGFKRALLGSVAEAITRRATRPVLIVRPTQRPR